jgi:hypothetical protein
VKKLSGLEDPDMRGVMPALRRAAKAALELGRQTGTPVYVMKNGRIVNINPGGKLKRPRRRPE